MLEILYEDSHFIAINKPAKLLVHRSDIDRHETRFAVQELRDQIGRYVWPVHRLDKGTSGVLLFAFEPQTVATMAEIFNTDQVKKAYCAVVRGWIEQSIFLDHAITPPIDPYIKQRKAPEALSAQTTITPWACAEIAFPSNGFETSRYALVQAEPLTGRRHQIRKHLKHLSHPILGDSSYGKGEHNRMMRDRFGVDRMLLHAWLLQFTSPFDQKTIRICAGVDDDWKRALQAFAWEGIWQDKTGLYL